MIRPFKITNLPRIKEIVLSLHPLWFDEKALQNIPTDAQLGKTFIAEEADNVQGFLILSSLEGQVWINWMGVDRQNHGHSIGTQLLAHAEEFLQTLGIQELRVNTVVEQTPLDGSYDRTVHFYQKNGYRIVEKKEIQTFEEFTFRRGILLKNL